MNLHHRKKKFCNAICRHFKRIRELLRPGFTQKSIPLRQLHFILDEFICQSCRQCRREWCFATLKCAFKSLFQRNEIKIKAFSKKPDVKEIFQTTVFHSQCNHSLEFFGNDCIPWIYFDSRFFCFQQNRIFREFRSRKDRIAETDIELQSNSCLVNPGMKEDTYPLMFFLSTPSSFRTSMIAEPVTS